jgi:hypothetical protein
VRLSGVWVVVLLSCKQPKQPLQPSYFTQPRGANDPVSCREVIDCYAQCKPLVEECLLTCDQKSTSQIVERARAVNYCGAEHNCAADRSCEQEHCVMQLESCPGPRYAPPAS